MTGTAPTRFVQWMASREHRDPRYGYVYRYHPRSDAHSKELCRLIVEDLIFASPSLRAHAEAGRLVYDINCKYTFPVSKKTKRLDFVIATGTPRKNGDLIAGSIRRAKAVDRVLLSCETKAVMTEHVKAKPRIFDELNSSHLIVHEGDPGAVAAGVTVVNIARTFVSPTRQSGGEVIVTTHQQPEVARQMIEHLRGLPIRADRSSVGFDAYATLVIDCDNQHLASLWTDPPAPQRGDPDHYDTFLGALSRAYEQRFGEQGL